MISPMDRVEIVCLRSELPAMVPALQEQGVLHVEEVSLALENHPGFLHRVHLPEGEKQELSELEALETLLKESSPLLSGSPSVDAVASVAAALRGTSIPSRLKAAKLWNRTLRTLHRRKLNIQDDMTVIKNYGRLVESITPLLITNGAILGETARAIILEGYDAESVDALKRDIANAVSASCGVVSHKLDRNKLCLIVTHPADKGEALGDFLAARGIKVMTSPDQEARGASVDEVMSKIGARIAEMQADLDAVLSELQAFTAQEGAKLVALQKMVSDRIGQLRVVDSFAQSDMVGVIHGWVPSESYGNLVAALKEKFGDKAIVGHMDHHDIEHKRVPTKLNNHPLIQPFELIMKLMKPATYGSFDPTALVAVSFIVFYGFVLGDAGYGAILVAIGLWGRAKWSHIAPVRDGMTIFTWMGVSSVVFGIIYWEIFGALVEDMVGDYSIFHRAHHTDALLYLAILFGAIHIPLCLVLGIKEGFAHGHNKHAEEKLGMLLGLIALAVALGSASVGSVLGILVALALFGGGVYFLWRSMGVMAPMGIMEIIGLTANIFSYSRLMALGLVSIAFAEIANALPEMLGGGVVGIVIGIPMAVAVHALNIFIGVFSPTIHSLRLNFVEFLPKFYEAEGRSYEPFRKEMVW
jgi:V/A-type H+-transporting ATPase subunit I